MCLACPHISSRGASRPSTFWYFLWLCIEFMSVAVTWCHLFIYSRRYIYSVIDILAHLNSNPRIVIPSETVVTVLVLTHELSWMVSILTISESVEWICLAAPSPATTCPQTLRSWGIPEPPEPQQTLESAPWQQSLDYIICTLYIISFCLKPFRGFPRIL